MPWESLTVGKLRKFDGFANQVLQFPRAARGWGCLNSKECPPSLPEQAGGVFFVRSIVERGYAMSRNRNAIGSHARNALAEMQLEMKTIGERAQERAGEFGDVARLDASFQYRLWPRSLGSGVPGFLYGILEGNLIHQNKNRRNGAQDPDSGGTTLLLMPGLQYVTKRWIVEGGVQIPVVQDLNGTALEKDYLVRFGFRFNF